MSLPTISLIAIALAMDAFAVSISSGVTIRRMHLRHALRIATFFGGFQAIMPIAGWSVGRFAAELVREWDHWIAFILLAALGYKMIHEALGKASDDEKKANPLNLCILLTLAIATSLDAAAVGVTLSFLKVTILLPSVVIGIVTFFVSLAGTYIGQKSGEVFGNKVEVLGGVVLIGIGTKILIEHLFFQ